MESKSKKQQKEQGKVFCDVCKKSIPQWLMPKHQYCQQHLKAKAARMFYQSKSKDNPYKKLKEDPELYGKSQATTFTTDYGQAMVNNQEATITKSKSKGIWALINDESTGNVYFKNRLSGKTQKNRPVGLLDEDFDEEVVQTIVVPQNSENIEEFEEIDEEEQARVGD